MSSEDPFLDSAGSALLLTLIALSILSLLGLYMTLNANTAIKISDNYESQVQATYAALGGLNHAGALVRGIDFEALLKGPDGSCSKDPFYLGQAKGFGFRNPIDISTANSLNISDPLLGAVPDDGLISTGFWGGSNGTVLIPKTGIAMYSPNPYGPGNLLTSRYFVKVTDNNGEDSEISEDPDDDPFVDGDGVVIVRSIGVSRTFSEMTGLIRRLNSVVVFEARFKRLSAPDLGPALVVLGSNVNAVFDGNCRIAGGVEAGIGTIDTDSRDGIRPEQVIRAAVGAGVNITGGGQPVPSIRDITAGISSNPDRAVLLNPGFLWDFIRNRAPKFADSYFEGNQFWSGKNAPYSGSYDIARPWNAPGQDPRITVVNGDLHVDGNFSGGGLLVVTGDLVISGPYSYNGLVLVVGSGVLAAEGSGQGIEGGILVAGILNQGAEMKFLTPGLSIKGSSRFISNGNAVRMALGLIPVSQISLREIAGSDP